MIKYKQHKHNVTARFVTLCEDIELLQEMPRVATFHCYSYFKCTDN